MLLLRLFLLSFLFCCVCVRVPFLFANLYYCSAADADAFPCRARARAAKTHRPIFYIHHFADNVLVCDAMQADGIARARNENEEKKTYKLLS